MTALPQVLDFVQAQSLRDNMAALLGSGALVLDASAVERMSTPCAQVLLAAARSAGSIGISFSISTGSDAFRLALADLGLESEFKQWMA